MWSLYKKKKVKKKNGYAN